MPAQGDAGFNPLADTLGVVEVSFAFQDDADAPAEMVQITVDNDLMEPNHLASTTFNSGAIPLLLSLVKAGGIASRDP